MGRRSGSRELSTGLSGTPHTPLRHRTSSTSQVPNEAGREETLRADTVPEAQYVCSPQVDGHTDPCPQL